MLGRPLRLPTSALAGGAPALQSRYESEPVSVKMFECFEHRAYLTATMIKITTTALVAVAMLDGIERICGRPRMLRPRRLESEFNGVR